MSSAKVSTPHRFGLHTLSLFLLFTSSPVAVAHAAAVPIGAPAVTTSTSANDALRGFVIPPKQAKKTFTVVVTAYSSTVEECDADPFITADGSRVRDGIIAANFLPFNTKVRIPEYFGQKIFEVHDRMSTRFPNRVDVWMGSTKEMRKFGLRRNVKVELVEMGDGISAWKKKTVKK